ncbi:MAG TPA: PilZ domain-containing protein [Candidatus Acidoferrales bacterium]|nr:PilZ domain-containing protein [Candidatus Acidoferrales bacterium]
MQVGTERRTSRRFTMSLPVRVRRKGSRSGELLAHTRDVSFRGLYFLGEANFEKGAEIEFVLTLPKEVTLSGEVNIRCFGEVVRVEAHNSRRGIAARIDTYEFLPPAA